MMDVIRDIENGQKRETPLPDFGPGDTVKVYYRVREGARERTQIFEGTVIQVNNSSRARRWSFTVRRISNGVGVERVFPADSPKLEDVEVVRRGRVRRARLYYLRDRVGKKAKVKEARYAPDEAAIAARKAERKALRHEKRAAQREARANRDKA
jgi:large subunit ribosomal protein L19